MPFFARVSSPGDDDESKLNTFSAATNNNVNGSTTFSASPWWSLEEGPVKIVGYSTEHDFSPGSQQFSFLERELLSADKTDRKRTPWLVVVGHRPMYIDSNFSGRAAPRGNVAALNTAETPLNASDIAVSRDLRAELEPLFLKAGVDATFHGHHHSWQRTCATDGSGECVFDAENNDGGGGEGSEKEAHVQKSSVGRNATTHLVIGHAGGDFTDGSLQVPTPPLFRSVEFQHGHARLRANGKEMTVEAVRASDGKVFDSVTLRKRGGDVEQPSPVVPPPPSASSPPLPAAANAAAVATASTKEKKAARLLSQRRILLRGGEVAAAVAASTMLSG